MKNGSKRGPLQGPPADTILEEFGSILAPFWTPEAPKTSKNRFRRASEGSFELRSILHAIWEQKPPPSFALGLTSKAECAGPLGDVLGKF